MNEEIKELETFLYDDELLEYHNLYDAIMTLLEEMESRNLIHIYIFSQITKIFYDKIFFLSKINPNDSNIKKLYPETMLKKDNTFLFLWKGKGSLLFKNNTCSFIHNKIKIFELDISEFIEEKQYIIIVNMAIEAIQITDNKLKDLFVKYL